MPPCGPTVMPRLALIVKPAVLRISPPLSVIALATAAGRRSKVCVRSNEDRAAVDGHRTGERISIAGIIAIRQIEQTIARLGEADRGRKAGSCRTTPVVIVFPIVKWVESTMLAIFWKHRLEIPVGFRRFLPQQVRPCLTS